MASELSIRFKEAYDHLLSQKKVSGYKDFAIKIGISTSMVTEIFKGRCNVGATALQNIVKSFEIDGNWLLTGTGRMIQTSKKTNLSLTPSDIIQNIPKDDPILYKLYKEKDIEVGDLKEMIGRLKAYIELLEDQKQRCV